MDAFAGLYQLVGRDGEKRKQEVDEGRRGRVENGDICSARASQSSEETGMLLFCEMGGGM